MIYNILWLDDDHNKPVFIPFKVTASKKMLNVTYCEFSDDFLMNLRNGNCWDAVIIDIIGKKNKDYSESDKGFIESFMKITKDSPSLLRFIFSGQESILKHDGHIKDIVSANTADYSKDLIYDKADGVDKLLNDLVNAIEGNPFRKIQIKYQNVFDAFTNQYIGNEGILELTEILVDINSDKPTINDKPYFTQLRIILEYVFRAANRIGLLCDVCIGKDGKVNLTDASRFLAGLPTMVQGINYQCSKTHFPRILADNIRNLLYITGGASHSIDAKYDDQINLELYKSYIETPYLLYSLAFIICDLIIWFKNYVDQNNDIEYNKSLWEVVSKESTNYVGEIEQDNEKNYFCGKFSLPFRKVSNGYTIGDKIEIMDYEDNTSRTKELYSKFSNKFRRV